MQDTPEPASWQSISANPNSPAVRAYIKQRLLSCRGSRINDEVKFLLDFARDRSVLDIGVVAHTIERTEDPEWKHNAIRSVARSLVGADIAEDGVKSLQARGYDVRLVDATSEADMGERFERVVLGDVIEHVNDPVALLRFAARHLAEGGKILCTTPNPFFIGNLTKGFRDDTFIANAEHVFWITPSMALELGERAQIRLDQYYNNPGRVGDTFPHRCAIAVLKAFKLYDKELFAGSYYYVYTHKSAV